MAYSESYFTARESWRDWRIEAQALMDLARVTRGARVLELGCGGGGLLRLLRERGAIAVGVDTLDVALNLARERGEWRVTRGATDAALPVTRHTSLALIDGKGVLPFRADAFDAILGQHIVEHIPDVDAALSEWLRLLKPGGRLALATPNARYPDPAHFADADHARVFSPDELHDAVARAGFSVQVCYTIFPFLSRVRAFRVFGVIAFRVFSRMPYFASRGRTILISARKPEQ